MSGCSRVMRKSICDRHPQGPSGIHVPTLPSPVCSLSEDVRRRVRLGERLFPNLTGQKFSVRLRAVAQRVGYEKAGRLEAHRLRMGGAADSGIGA